MISQPAKSTSCTIPTGGSSKAAGGSHGLYYRRIVLVPDLLLVRVHSVARKTGSCTYTQTAAAKCMQIWHLLVPCLLMVMHSSTKGLSVYFGARSATAVLLLVWRRGLGWKVTVTVVIMLSLHRTVTAIAMCRRRPMSVEVCSRATIQSKCIVCTCTMSMELSCLTAVAECRHHAYSLQPVRPVFAGSSPTSLDISGHKSACRKWTQKYKHVQ